MKTKPKLFRDPLIVYGVVVESSRHKQYRFFESEEEMKAFELGFEIESIWDDLRATSPGSFSRQGPPC